MVNIEELKRIENLKVFIEEDLQRIGKIGQLHIFSKGTKIFTQDTRINNIYIMISGDISITREVNKDVTIIMDKLRPGTFFGISSLVGIKTFNNAVCNSPSEVLALPVDSLRQYFEEVPGFGSRFIYELLKFYHRIIKNRTLNIIKAMESHLEDMGELPELSFLAYSG